MGRLSSCPLRLRECAGSPRRANDSGLLIRLFPVRFGIEQMLQKHLGFGVAAMQSLWSAQPVGERLCEALLHGVAGVPRYQAACPSLPDPDLHVVGAIVVCEFLIPHEMAVLMGEYE